MKTKKIPRILLSFWALVVIAPFVLAQAPEPVDTRKGPVSKLYLAETKGESQIQNGAKIYAAKQATAFDAPGTVIETKEKSHNALVYSNGSGLFVDENTRVEINRFSQEPFLSDQSNRLDSLYEPSVSQSDVFLSRGAIGLCTSQLLSGSSMVYATANATINIRGGKVVIETKNNETIVDLLEGDLTVRAGTKDVGGQILRPGDRAIIRPATAPGLEPTITIEPISREALLIDYKRVELACHARRAVTFEVIERRAVEGLDQGTDEAAGAESEAAGAGQEIVPRPTVLQNPPTNIVVSPDRLPGT